MFNLKLGNDLVTLIKPLVTTKPSFSFCLLSPTLNCGSHIGGQDLVRGRKINLAGGEIFNNEMKQSRRIQLTT